MKTVYLGGGSGSGGGSVTSVFGRAGTVVAVAGDYDASQVGNDSSVTGSTVKDALNNLLAAIPTSLVASDIGNDSGVAGLTVKDALDNLLAAIPSVPVSSVFGRIGAVVAAANDYDASEVNNDSGNPGATVKAALEACLLVNGTRALAGSWSLGNSLVSNARVISYFAENDVGNSGAAKTVDWTLGQAQKITLTANCTLTFTAPPGVCTLQLKVIQDGVGSRTIVWPGTVNWPGGFAPVLSTAPGSIDLISLYYDGANYYGSSVSLSAADGVTITLSGTGLLQRAALSGDITAAAGSNTTAIAAGVIVNADINAAAAVAGTKISPNFGAQDVTTTGVLNLGATLPTVGEMRVANGFRLNSITTALVNVNVVQFTSGNSAVFGSSSAGSILNGTTTSLRVSNSDYVVLTGGVVALAVANLRFDSTVTAPVIFQQTTATNSATGQLLSIHAQDCSGTTTTGGDFEVRPGSGTTAGGVGRIRTGGTTVRLKWDDTGLAFYTAATVAQAARVGQLTDSTTGTPSATLVDAGAAYSQANVNNNFASVLAKINGIETAIHNIGLTA